MISAERRNESGSDRVRSLRRWHVSWDLNEVRDWTILGEWE